MLGIVSYCAIVTLSLRRTVFFSRYLTSKNVDLEIRVRGPSSLLEISPFDRVHTTYTQCRKMSWPWNPGQRSLEVIKNDTIQSDTHDFLLTFHSNHQPISHHFRNKQWLKSKIANFPTPCILCPCWRGSPWNWVSALGSEKTGIMVLLRWSKKFQDRFSRLDCMWHPTSKTDTLRQQ